MYKSIALVDLSCLFKRTFEANPNAGARNTLDEIVRISERVEHMILCLDAPPYARKLVFADYKAHREEPTTTELYQKKLLKDWLRERGFRAAWVEGAEADDVIATLARVYGETTPEVWLVGADKDLAQCVTDNVLQLVPKHGERAEHFRGPEQVKEKFEVTPSQIPLYLALVGDKTDNIPGVKGIGPVKAAGLINEFKTFVGIADGLNSIGGQVGKALAEGWNQLALSLKLTTLDSHLPLDAEALLVKQEPKPPEGEPEFTGNQTPMPEGPSLATQIAAENAKLNLLMNAEPVIGKDPRADEFLRQQAAERNADRAARESHEKELERAKEQQPKKEKREKLPSEQPGFPAYGSPDFAPQQGPHEVTWAAEQARQRVAAGVVDETGRPKVAGFDPISPPPAPSAAPAPVAAAKPVAPLPGPAKAKLRGLALLRAPFEKHQIGKLAKGSKEQTKCAYNEKRSCSVCGGFHHPKMIHLDYVGHAALTDRLLEADPLWSWEPMAFAPNGLPLLDPTGGLWIRLTVCGVTRLGYGHAKAKEGEFIEPGAREKELIGDALRNAAMRFGVALDLWHKGDDLHDDEWDPAAAWQDAFGGAA